VRDLILALVQSNIFVGRPPEVTSQR